MLLSCAPHLAGGRVTAPTLHPRVRRKVGILSQTRSLNFTCSVRALCRVLILPRVAREDCREEVCLELRP